MRNVYDSGFQKLLLMKVSLSYGEGRIWVELPDHQTTLIEPSPCPGLTNERSAILDALKNPIQSSPLIECISPEKKVCILFTDLTRATPNDRLIPYLLEHLKDHPKENIFLVNQLGTHRPNTRDELCQMLGNDIVQNYRVLNHDCEDRDGLIQLGHTKGGVPALINKEVVDADLRIVTGFIEPHFFAGFSGGPKGLMPGVAGMETVMSNHGEKNIGDPRSTFGITEGNPLWEELRDIALRCGRSFLLNVTLNDEREITGVFAGDLIAAHKQGCEFVKRSAMQSINSPFDIVITTNSGYPLDLNLYQGVKGMSAGARILKEKGLLILACECREGVPENSHLDRLLQSASCPEEVLTMLSSPGFIRPEQWQAQVLALIQRKAEVLVYSSLDDQKLRKVHLRPCHNIEGVVKQKLSILPNARIAVLPQGPLTIPYLV